LQHAVSIYYLPHIEAGIMMQVFPSNLPSTPSSQLTLEFEKYIGELLAQHLEQLDFDHQRTETIEEAVHQMRGAMTSMNLRVYLIENAPLEDRTRHIVELKAAVNELSEAINKLMERVHPPETPRLPANLTH
jgi:hypothetical protein